jgi:hypothetical protein
MHSFNSNGLSDIHFYSETERQSYVTQCDVDGQSVSRQRSVNNLDPRKRTQQ